MRHLEAKEVSWEAGTRQNNLPENSRWLPVMVRTPCGLSQPGNFLARTHPVPSRHLMFWVGVWLVVPTLRAQSTVGPLMATA